MTAALLALAAVSAAAAQPPLTDFLSGEHERALEGYRSLAASPSADAAADAAAVLKGLGRPKEAAALWLKASRLEPGDPFLLSQRGWNALSLEEAGEAESAFREAVAVSSGTAAEGEALLGLALSQAKQGRLQDAVHSLQAASARSPAVLPSASAELARLAARMGRMEDALSFYSTALSGDPRQLDALREAARAFERAGRPREAWQAWRMALELDPADEEAVQAARRLLAGFKTDPEATLLASRRLSRPLRRRRSPEPASAPLRLDLFADEAGAPRPLRRVYLMPSADARLQEEGSEAVLSLPADSQWEALALPEAGAVALKDASGNVVLTARRRLKLSPGAGGSVLLKQPELQAAGGIDARDREVRGEVELSPGPAGFTVVNALGVEEYLPAMLGGAMGSDAPPEAAKALAVLLRSRAQALAARGAHVSRSALCDSRHCQLYFGMAQETAAASAAARATRGRLLKLPLEALEHHDSCGWATAAGIQDRPSAAPGPASPSALERLAHAPPDPAHYDGAAERAAGPGAVRWLLILSGEDLRRRLGASRPVGALTDLRVLARDPDGRVQSLAAEGERGRAVLDGMAEMSAVLAPGALRSRLFVLQPLYNGKRLERLLVWGAGTGHARGFCRAGAIGQARLGRSFRQILSHYFPHAKE